MSLHKNPKYQDPQLIQALKDHEMVVDGASQLADAFRLGWMAKEKSVMGDGRPCHMDVFVAALLEDSDLCSTDLQLALTYWNEGDWPKALALLNEEARQEILKK